MIHRRLPPGHAAARNRRDIDVIRRRLRTSGGQTRDEIDDAPLEATFSHAGTPTTATSGRWYPRRTARLTDVVVSLGTAGSSSTVVTVYVNGGSQGTITLGSGVNKATGTFDDVLTTDDYLTVAATTVGTGAANLVVQSHLE